MYVIAKTNEHRSCQDFVSHYLHEIIRQLDLCNDELSTQSQSCPSVFLPLDILDRRLKDFVILQRNYLLKRNSEQLARFKDLIHEKNLFQNITKHQLDADQVWNQS